MIDGIRGYKTRDEAWANFVYPKFPCELLIIEINLPYGEREHLVRCVPRGESFDVEELLGVET